VVSPLGLRAEIDAMLMIAHLLNAENVHLKLTVFE
jgi:hypothetical protein